MLGPMTLDEALNYKGVFVGRGWDPIIRLGLLQIRSTFKTSLSYEEWISTQKEGAVISDSVMDSILPFEYVDKFRVNQIKSKFCDCRFYFEPYHPTIAAIASMVEASCRTRCADCGVWLKDDMMPDFLKNAEGSSVIERDSRILVSCINCATKHRENKGEVI